MSKGRLSETPNIPGYLVAMKSLHRSAGLEATELLEEAAIMAQFECKYLVSLIGVVTAGSPILVILEYCGNTYYCALLKIF